MGASEKHDAAFHPGDGPTPRTAVDVLREHIWWSTSGQCSCGALREVPMSTPQAWDLFAQHQAHALASAGLLATAEHDSEMFAAGHDHAMSQYVALGAIYGEEWLQARIRARADRTAAGEDL